MLRPWELNFTILRESPESIHQQLSTKLIHAIQTGSFGAGMPLPGTRELSERLGINRKTVIRVYDQLVAHGWLYTEHKRGTFVNHHPPKMAIADFLSSLQTDHLHLVSDTTYTQQVSSKIEDGVWIDLNYPYGDHRIFNFESLVRATRHAIISTKRMPPQSLQQLHGLQSLRQAIAQMLNFERGMNISPSHLYIAPTARMSLDIIAKTLFKSSDYLVLETCHHAMTHAVFEYHNIHTQTVKHHAQGIDIGDLEKLCINYPVRAIYLSPQCQQPTTAQMTTENRMQLLALAKRYDFYIIEDDTAAQFSYEPSMPASMASLSPNHVIYIGTLAHMMSASYKTVFMAIPSQLFTTMGKMAHHFEDGNDLITELTLTEMLLSGEVKKQLKRAQKIYQDRKDHCCKQVQQALGSYVQFEQPKAGFSLWVQLAQHVNMEVLARQLHIQQLKLELKTLHPQHQCDQIGFQLYFAHLNHDEITLAVKRLKLAFASMKAPIVNMAYG